MDKEVREFCEFERQNNLFLRSYLGVPYWQFVRFAICEGVFSPSLENKEVIERSRGRIEIVFKFIKELLTAFQSYFAMKGIGEHELICFKTTHNHDRFYNYWNMPEMIDSVDIRSNNDISDIKNGDNYNILGPYLRANISYLVKKHFHLLKNDVKEREFLELIVKKLTKTYGRCPSVNYIEDLILRYSEYSKCYTPFWEKLFCITKCKAILVVWYYQVPMMIAYKVARQKNIQIIELQHGVINNHEEYWFEDQSGINNYTPDYFLAFGEQHITWSKMLPTTMSVAVGYPYQEYMIQKLSKLMTEEKTIVIYPETNSDFEMIVDQLVNYTTEKGYRILMKLHPLQTEHYDVYYPILSRNKNIEIITDQSKGIYYWLKLGKHHIMANTTVGFEALVFPHTNICIAVNVNHEQLQPLIDWKFARGFSTADELINLIESPDEKDKYIDRNQLWKKHGAENIEGFLTYMHNSNWLGMRAYKNNKKRGQDHA